MNRLQALAEMQAILDHPRGVIGRMSDLERDKGFIVVPHGARDPVPFSEMEWDDGVISIDPYKAEIRLVAIRARVPGRGALRRLLNRIEQAGYTPCIVEPIGSVMPALVRRWGWHCRMVEHENEVANEWRPRVGEQAPNGG